ncbi:MAG: hydroxymethylglutaryl-CoA reductase, degradative [Chloroflexi bacterium]|nr:hydroxymethylglutaryl-CoA reductase, degradative [Chloroflexota bacterium]
MDKTLRSAIPGFYGLTVAERQAIAKEWAGLGEGELESLRDSGLSLAQADLMIENVIGRYSLPLAVATNFKINDRDYLVPMVIEEASVVAACSSAAKLFRQGGGFTASADEPIMIGQIQLLDLADMEAATGSILARKAEILARANEGAGSIVARGGGALDLEIRPLRDTEAGDMLILHLHCDVRDAMGANLINAALERIAPLVERISGGRVNLRILSNLSDRRLARASGTIPREALAMAEAPGTEVIQWICEAAAFAAADPYRAATHNKGIMNGIDALMLATGNDWRAVEAGAHAYASRNGRYRSLTTWSRDSLGNLRGEIELPLAAGIIGGATRIHRGAQTSLKLLGVKSAQELAQVAAAVGLAQNLAAIRALATDGIQKGHMRLHARQLALAAGAAEENVRAVAAQMVDEGNIGLARAQDIVREQRDMS